jgi:hypothetical protein
MRKLLFGLTAAAALAFAVPGAALAQHHSSGGGHSAGHMSGGSAMRGPSARSFSSNAGVNRNFTGNRSARINNRNIGTRNLAVNNRGNNFARNGRYASNDRHRHHGRGGWGWPGYFYGGYDDYAGYDSCYQYVWTPGGYAYVNTCGSNYYGVY